MKIAQITTLLESLAPIKLQESYDNCGLITGDRNTEITNVLITLDATEDIVDEAIKNGCNLIIAHHPIVFFGLKKFSTGSYVERAIIKAIKNDIAIYACHTNLDKIHEGVNGMICRKLGLSNVSILSKDKNNVNENGLYYGSGMIGEFEESESALDFLYRVKKTFNCGSIKHTNIFKHTIKKVAVCGGAGFFLLKDAIRAGADLFITSDITYHQFFDADNKIILADMGHYESEQFTKELISDILNTAGIKSVVSGINTNPVKYLL